MTHVLRVTLASLAMTLALPTLAHAADFKLFGREWTLTLTNSFNYTYFSDNDGIKDDPSTPANEDLNSNEDDRYHRIFNNLDFNLGTGDVRIGARLDVYIYINDPNTHWCNVDKPPSWCSQRTHRFINHYGLYRKGWVLPERLYISINKPAYDLTLGDFYASFGKGIALNAVKFGNVGQDNMIRGGKLVIHEGELGFTFLAGQFNILDTDEGTGRVGDANFPRTPIVHDPNTPRSTWKRALDAPWDPSPVIAGRLEYRFFDAMLVGTHTVLILQNRPSHSAPGETGIDYDWINGATISLPDIANDKLSVDFEVDLMRSVRGGTVIRGWGIDEAAKQFTPASKYAFLPGLAAYMSVTYSEGNTTVNFEAKHYDDYEVAPLSSGDTPYPLLWATPPTLERVIAQVTDNRSTTGARLRIDYNFNQLGPIQLLAYASYSFQRTRQFGQHSLHDFFGGTEMQWQGGRGHWNNRVGIRREWDLEADEQYRRDIFWEGDIEQPIAGKHAIDLTWLYQRRTRRLLQSVSWNVLDTYLSYKWSPYLAVALTMELQSDPTIVHESRLYFGGSIRYFFNPGTYVGVRFGQNRGGLKCLNGICRVYPAFAGIRVLAVVRL